MTTSLAQQLQKLAAPQTTVTLADARSRASILFDPKTAATKDRRAIYEIGLTGLQELTDFNPAFKEFQLTLFDEATLTLERSVELPEVNKMLDAAIAKFLRLLSPYILLRPAHMAFEWLLRRFQIHEYNRGEVMALILPYHETNIFVQILQTMRLREADAEWFWLRPLQRPGVPLAKTALINRAASNPAFLSFVCRSTRKAVKELGPRAHQLQAQINFYATIVVGALQTAKPLEDWHISTILEALLQGLLSDTIDFMAASYVIVAQLVSRTKLKTKVCNALLERVANCPFERLQTESLLLLVCIYGKQQAAGPQLKPETVLNFIGQKWLIAALASLANGNFAIQSLCMPLMTGAVTAIREDDPSSGSYKQFLDNLLSDVPLPKPSAQQLINCFLDTFVSTESEHPAPSAIPMEEEDTIVIDSDDEMESEKSSFQTWYAAYLEKLEKRYPEAFDLSVKEALRARSTTSNRQKALKLALGFRLNTSDEKAKRVYEKLYHYSPDWRLSAVQQLVQNLKTGKKRERSVKLLQECLPDRINDDSGAVVAAILSLPTEELLQMLEPVVFAQTLCRLLRRAQAQQKQKEWRALVPLSVQHLTTTAVSNHYDTNLVLLALMPLLFPSEPLAEHEHCALLMILKSEFCAKVPFLGQVKVSKKYPEFAVSKHRQHFLDVIAGSSRELFSQEQALLQSVEEHGGEAHMQDASQLTHLLLLLTAYAKRQLQPQESLHILERICQYSRGIQFRVNKSHRSDQNFVPLQLYLDFLLTLARNTKWAGLVATPWTQPTDGLRLCLRLMEILSAQVFTERCDAEERLEWTQALKRCLSIMLPAPQHKLEFLSNFCVFERVPELWANDSDYTVLRVQGFLLLEAVVANQDSKLECSLLHVLRVANACGSPLQTLRLQAMDTLQLMSQRELEPHVQQLVKALLKRRSEVGMDHEQYALILYTILQPEHATPKEKLLLSKLRRSVLALASDPEQPPICTDFLLRALKHVNDESFLTALLPLGIAALEKITLEQGPNSQLKQLPWPYSEIYKSVMERYEGNIALNVLQLQPLAWDLFEASFAHHDAYIQLDQKLQPVPCVLLGILTPETYERLQSKHKVSLIRLIVEAATKADNDSIFLASHRLLKRCRLECQPLVQMLTEMCGKGVRAKTPTRRGSTATKQVDLTNASWKQGMTLLELLESKKQLIGSELLIPTLFELLQSCLTLEEHTAAEYPKQLILSSLLHCCQTAQAAGVQLAKALPESCFRIEQVVQCLRNTKNPQTQQHALLFLTHCAGLYPQQVLHKIVEIFTFVGSTVARHDDAFSLHIIHNVVESIIPILLLNTGQRDRLVIPVLKVFADICTDVPVHRRLSLYATLFRVLDPKAHLWQFLCILFESQVLLESLPHKVAVDKSRLDFARELTLMFQEPSVALETCIRLLEYLGQLPVDKSNQSGASGGGSSSLLSTEQQLFDVRTRSFKQLRHYKYVIMDYLSGISSSIEWQAKMKSANPGDLLPHYQALILQTLAFVDVISRALEAASGNSSLEKYWRVLSNHAQDVLDNAIGMLAPEYFLHVITDLLEHPLIQVRIKVLELLVTKLTPTCDYFAHSTTEHFGVLFAPLEAIINGILDSGSSNPQQAQLQQTALQALQLLAHRHGRDFLDECRSLLATLTKITKRRSNVPKAVVGNVVLTLGEICSSLKAHALAQLPKFAPQLTEFLKEQVHQMVTHKQGPDYVCSTLVTAFHKLFKALPLFLGPYLVDIISALVRLSVQLNSPLLAQEKRAQALRLRLQELWSVVAHGVEVRILVPSCTKTYSSLLELQAFDEVGQLMSQLLLQCVKHNTNAQLQPVQEALSEFFLQALEFRLQVRGRGQERSQVSQIEGGISEAFVTWILKLSESSFRPMYSKVHKWAKESSARETQLTYFLLTNRIAEALKSLFVLFANDFIGDSSQLLQQHNTLNAAFTAGDNAEDDEELLVAILGTLNHVFLHCTDEFINEHRFNTLMQPLVDQLENDLVLGSEPLQLALSNCIAQLAVATNDVMWKQLNSQVLLKTRTTTPEVRILAFNTCVSIARKLGESFAPLLPETVPFVAELLEDEHQRVEKNTRNGVQELEAILGEPIQKYL